MLVDSSLQRGSVVLRGVEIDLDSDIGYGFIVDCCRFCEGLLAEGEIKLKYGLTDSAWTRLTDNAPLLEAVQREKERRVRDSAAAREKAQHLFVAAPDVLSTRPGNESRKRASQGVVHCILQAAGGAYVRQGVYRDVWAKTTGWAGGSTGPVHRGGGVGISAGRAKRLHARPTLSAHPVQLLLVKGIDAATMLVSRRHRHQVQTDASVTIRPPILTPAQRVSHF
jgi:hypothetical protein